MKLIEALKQLKNLERKLEDLSLKVRGNTAMMDYQKSPYENPAKQLKSWIDCHSDTLAEYSRLHCAINKTNLQTSVPIDFSNNKTIDRTIAEWILRKRKLHQHELYLWNNVTDQGLKDTPVKDDSRKEGDELRIARVVRHYNVEERDNKMEALNEEKFKIDAALEIINATTDLIE